MRNERTGGEKGGKKRVWIRKGGEEERRGEERRGEERRGKRR